MWPLRSMLFVPANKPDWVKKSARVAPDSVVLDLEDAVPPAEKIGARAMARESIGLLKELGIVAVVRVNSIGSGGLDDVMAVTTEGLAAVMLPKAHSVQEVRDLDRVLSHAEGRANIAFNSVAILPVPETPQGIWDARAMAEASPRVKGLMGVVGGPVSGDVARAAGFSPTLEGSEQFFMNSKIVLDSRAANALFPMAGIIGTRLDDMEAVRQLILRAKRFGYTGAMLIHPSHVKVANEVFTPSQEEVDYYSGLIAAMREGEKAGSGAVAYKGQMIDYAMIFQAEEVIKQARRFGLLKD